MLPARAQGGDLGGGAEPGGVAAGEVEQGVGVGDAQGARAGPGLDDGVPGLDGAFADDAHVEAGPVVADQQRGHLGHAQAQAHAVAGDPGLGDLELGAADAVPVPDAGARLDFAVDSALGGRRRMQPFQQHECPGGQVLREQQPGQHEVLGFSGVGRFVLGAQISLLDPPLCGGHVALGQQQPGVLGGNGIEQAGNSRIRGEPRGLEHRVQGPRQVSLRLPDPGEQGQADGKQRRIDQLPVQGDALGDVAPGRIELSAGVGNLGQPNVSVACRGRRSLPEVCGDVRCLLVRPDRGAETPLGALDLAKWPVAPYSQGQGSPAHLPPCADAGRKAAFCLGEPAAQPVSHRQRGDGVGLEHGLVVADLGEGPGRERSGSSRRLR